MTEIRQPYLRFVMGLLRDFRSFRCCQWPNYGRFLACGWMGDYHGPKTAYLISPTGVPGFQYHVTSYLLYLFAKARLCEKIHAVFTTYGVECTIYRHIYSDIASLCSCIAWTTIAGQRTKTDFGLFLKTDFGLFFIGKRAYNVCLYHTHYL